MVLFLGLLSQQLADRKTATMCLRMFVQIIIKLKGWQTTQWLIATPCVPDHTASYRYL